MGSTSIAEANEPSGETAPRHTWDLTPAAARAVQERLRGGISLTDATAQVGTIAGVDTGFEAGGRMARAAVAVFAWPDATPLASAIGRCPTPLPYIPGLLSFRELPAVLEALEQLESLPDLLLCDGQGIAHPRRLGIASHLGLWLDRPTIGVGKTRLVGHHEEPGRERGDRVPLEDAGERIGTVVRSRTGVRPVYVSPGHRVSHDSAVEWVLATARYRLPEPIRQADRLASRRGATAGASDGKQQGQ